MNYINLVPLWIRSDPQFNIWWKKIIALFTSVSEVQENIKSSLELKLENYNTFEKITKILNIPRQEILPPGNIKVTSVKKSGSTWVITTETLTESLVIQITPLIRYYLFKYKLLMNNFDGTYKNLYESAQKSFSSAEELSFDFTEGISTNGYPELTINLNLNTVLDSLIEKESEEDYEKTDRYKLYNQYLNLFTLFYNGYFNFNIMGVILKYQISKNNLYMIWNEDNWNESLWDSSKEE